MRLPDRASDEHIPSTPDRRPAFPTTRWSIVLAAGRHSAVGSGEALNALCKSYWRPSYAYVRRLGVGVDDAQDTVQEFFTRLLEKHGLGRVDPSSGRFRAFLLTSLKNFIADQRDRGRAQKRGGGRPSLPLAIETAEKWYALEPADLLTPERVYDRRWALTLLDMIRGRLRRDFARTGNLPLFESLEPFLTGENVCLSHAALAAHLDMSEGAVTVAIHRARRRYRELLREEIRQTVATPEEVIGELRYLLDAVRLPARPSMRTARLRQRRS